MSAIPGTKSTTRFIAQADDLLRGNLWATRQTSGRRGLAQLLGYVLLFGPLYGAAMGSFVANDSVRCWQMIYSATKVPLLLLATFTLSLPSFWVLNMLLGLGTDFPRVLRALIATQGGLTIVLAALAPFTLLWYASYGDYQSAVLFNAAMFTIASVTAQLLLRRQYLPLIAANPKHRILQRLWVVIYAFVGIQMGWVLRPFIGVPDVAVEFFRKESWGNAYVVVAHMIFNVLRARYGR